MNTHYCTRPVLRCYHNLPYRTTTSQLRLPALTTHLRLPTLSQNQDRAIQLSPKSPLMWGSHIRALQRAQLCEHCVLLHGPQGIGSRPTPLVPGTLKNFHVLFSRKARSGFPIFRSPKKSTDLHQPCRAGVENCCRFLILYTQFLSFGEFGKQLPELLSKGQELCVQNRSRTNSSPRPPFCSHAMHSYSTAQVKFLRSARARGLLYRKKFYTYSTVDLV